MKLKFSKVAGAEGGLATLSEISPQRHRDTEEEKKKDKAREHGGGREHREIEMS